MAKRKVLGPDSANLCTFQELPIGATAIGIDPVGRKTGLWRYNRPEFVEKIPPCQNSCPLGNWVQKFIGEFAAENLEEAWKALKLENPFPGVCGRVCSHLCEEGCNREGWGGSVSIKRLERFLADTFSEKNEILINRKKPQGKRVAIVGSGPAGLSCAYFLTLLGYEATVFESLSSLGGIPRIGIPDYRLPKEIVEKEVNGIVSLGIETKTDCRVGKDITLEDLLKFDGVFMATGADVERPLGIPGERIHGVVRGWEFLKQCNLGECDPVGEEVLIVGGGNVAMDVARSVVRLGRRPKIIYRRTKDEMPALHEEIEEAVEEGVEFHFLLSPVNIRQEGRGKVRLECSQMKLKGVDEAGRPKPIPVKGVHRVFEAHQIIIASGEVPDLSFLNKDFKRAGKDLWTNEWGQTSVPHVFAGGDMTNTPRTIAHAIASAKKAAIAMDRFLNGFDLSQSDSIPQSMREHLGLSGHKFEFIPELIKTEDLNRAYAPSDERSLPRKIPIERRQKSFKEVNEGFSYEEAVREAQRCLSCGICKMCGNCYLFCPDAAVVPSLDGEGYLFNYDYCKGCGICQVECPVGAIMTKIEKGES